MSKKKKSQKKPWENLPELNSLKKQLDFLRKNKRKIHEDRDLYFNETQNQFDITEYYHSTSNLEIKGLSLFYKYHELLNNTHKNRVPYFISKDLYLYTWVDLHPDGNVKSIYSGEKKDPEIMILQDYEVITQKYEEFHQFLEKVQRKEFDSLKELKLVERQFKMNTEHVVPQSWFGALEPMKGDLHHLFVCEPECNIVRSNFPYDDFSFYQPESPDKPIQNNCGVSVGENFEPENGKGTVARAMMYFLLRYPREIRKVFRIQINLPLLIRWHHDFPVTLYEKHRNQAIYGIQGNRNPFIDFPDLVTRIEFPPM